MDLIMYFDIRIRTTLSHYFHKNVHKKEKFIVVKLSQAFHRVKDKLAHVVIHLLSCMHGPVIKNEFLVAHV